MAVAATFGSHAVVSGTLGPWMPRIKAQCGLEASGLGIALAGFATGMVLGTRLAAPLLARASGRAVVRVAVPVLAATLALLPLASGLGGLTSVFIGLGVTGGLLDVAMNAEAVAVERRFGRPVLATMHGVWSVAALAGAGVASMGLAAGLPLAIHVPAVAALLLVASAPVLAWLPPSSGVDGGAREEGPARAARGRAALLCAVGAASFLGEGVVFEWSAVYLRESVGAGAGLAGLGVVAFSGGMTASRLVGDRLTTRLAPDVSVRAGAALAAVSLAAALAVGSAGAAVVGFAVAGVGLGPIVPIVFRAAGELRLAGGKSALDVVVTAGYVGSITGPLAVGLLASAVGLHIALAVPVVACLVVLAAAGPALAQPRRA